MTSVAFDIVGHPLKNFNLPQTDFTKPYNKKKKQVVGNWYIGDKYIFGILVYIETSLWAKVT